MFWFHLVSSRIVARQVFEITFPHKNPSASERKMHSSSGKPIISRGAAGQIYSRIIGCSFRLVITGPFSAQCTLSIKSLRLERHGKEEDRYLACGLGFLSLECLDVRGTHYSWNDHSSLTHPPRSLRSRHSSLATLQAASYKLTTASRTEAMAIHWMPVANAKTV